MTGLTVSRIDALTNNEYNRDHGDLEMTSLCMFEQFLCRTKGEDVGVSPEDSFYMTEVALRAEAMALEKREIGKR